MKDSWEDPGAGVESTAGLLLRRAASDLVDTFGIDAERAAALGLVTLFELTTMGLRWDAWVIDQDGLSPCYRRAGRAFACAVIHRLAVTWESEDGRALRGRLYTRSWSGGTLGRRVLTVVANGKTKALFDTTIRSRWEGAS